jgi:hypothetical protein
MNTMSTNNKKTPKAFDGCGYVVFVVARARRNGKFPGVEKICDKKFFCDRFCADMDAEVQWRMDGRKGPANPYRVWRVVMTAE